MAKLVQNIFSSLRRGPGKEPEESLRETPSAVLVLIYSEAKEGDLSNTFEPHQTCEEVCFSLGKNLHITPTMLHCFSLAAFNKSDSTFLWLAPSDKLGSHANIHFRMRFLPVKDKCDQLEKLNLDCLKYFFFQVKWDFIHDMLEAYKKKDKQEASRGVVVLCILIMMRLDTEASGSQTENVREWLKPRSMKQFIPNSLEGNILDESYQTKGIVKHAVKKLKQLQVEENKKNFPVTRCKSAYLMNAYLKLLLAEDFYYVERYRATSGKPGASKDELQVRIQMGCESPSVSVVDKATGREKFFSPVSDLTEIEMEQCEGDSYKVNIRKFAHNQALLFATRSEAVSCVTCLEANYRLLHDFSCSLCTEVEPDDLKLKKKLRAHGPITDEFVKQKFKRREKLHDSGSKQSVYILRASPQHYHEYEVLYMDERTGKLVTCSLGKIEDEVLYSRDGQGAVRDLKVRIQNAILEGASCISKWIRLNMQSEGCDLLQGILLKESQVNLQEEEEEEASARVYNASALQLGNLIGQGHFTETYEAVLGNKDVVVKRLRYSEIPDSSFKHVQEAFQAGCDRLLALRNPKYFVEFLGMVLSRTPAAVMRLYRYGNLRSFLQTQEPREHQLTMKHLCQVVVKLAEALDYLDEKNLCHGNIHCDNIMVSKFDRNELNVDIGDPGLIALYNKLGLESQINKRRLPWIAPELYGNLFDTTLKSDMFALGTTLWQMFSEGRNPLDVETDLKHKRVPACEFFSEGRCLSRPLYLKKKRDDSKGIQSLKNLLYTNIMKDCWKLDPEERTNPKTFLKTFNSLLQDHTADYHDYNIIEEFDSEIPGSGAGSTAASSCLIYSRGMMSTIQTRDMPIYDLRLLDRRAQVDGSLANAASGDANHTIPSSPGNNMQEQQPAPGNTGDDADTAVSPWVPMPGGPLDIPGAGAGAGAGDGAAAAVQGPRPPGQQAKNGPLPSLPVTNVRHLIDMDKLSVDRTECVGSGHYGSIYKGRLAPTSNLGLHEPTNVAVKVLKPNIADDYGQEFMDEAKVMEQLDHKNIVKFYGVCMQGQYLVMEFVDNQCLYKYVKRQGSRCGQETLLKFCVDISAGMEYLSSMKVLHRDLAARNVLITQGLDAKISDFGISKVLAKDKDYYRRDPDINKNIPILWSAPEWIGLKKFTTKSDVWSFAVTLWEVYSQGRVPNICDNLDEFRTKGIKWLKEGRRLKKPARCHDDVYALMMECWDHDPDKRPHFKDCHTRLRAIAGFTDPELDDHPQDYSKTNSQNKLIPNQNIDGDRGATAANINNTTNVRLVNGHSTAPVISQKKPETANGNMGMSSLPDLSRNNRVPMLVKTKYMMVPCQNSRLGHGAFGEVYKGTYNGCDVAVKRCTKDDEYDRFRREIELLYRLNHRNIVQYIGTNYYKSNEGDEKLEYAMEYLKHGNLSNHLKDSARRGHPIEVATKLKYLIDIAQGMDYLFKLKILHCDLTAVNVLLAGTEGDFTAKISDFGWAKELFTEVGDDSYFRRNAKFKRAWAALEVFNDTYNHFSDIWSYGSLAVEVFDDGKYPDFDPTFDKENQTSEIITLELIKRLKNGERYKRPENCPIHLYDNIFCRCWLKEASQRIRFEEIIQTLQSFRENIDREGREAEQT